MVSAHRRKKEENERFERGRESRTRKRNGTMHRKRRGNDRGTSVTTGGWVE